MKDSFDMVRFAMLLKRDLWGNWKKNLWRFVGIYCIMTLISIVLMWHAENHFLVYPDHNFYNYVMKVFAFFTFLIPILWCWALSSVMSPMDTREKRIRYLMLPASRMEKFVSRLLIIVIGFWVMVTVAVLCMELTRRLFVVLFDYRDCFSGNPFPVIVSHFSDNFLGGRNPLSVFLVILLGWYSSCFLVGGNVWYHRPFLKTLLSLAALSFAAGMILVQLFRRNIDYISEHFSTVEQVTTVFQVLSVIFICLILLNIYLSYRLFKRSHLMHS